MEKVYKYISNAFKCLDVFGEPVTVLYRGKSKYNTKTGALLSLTVGVLLTAALIINC